MMVVMRPVWAAPRRGGMAALMLVACGAVACASSEGDARMRQRSFADAEAAYDRELAASPDDPDLTRKRDSARAEVIRAKLEQGRAMRAAGHGAAGLTTLVEALSLETRWHPNLPPDVAGLLEQEIAGAGEVIAETMRPALDGRAPLAARARVEKVLTLLTAPRLAPIRDKVNADIAAAGKAKCTELAAAEPARGPYFARLLASYCGAFGVTVAIPGTPEQRRGLRISGRVDNTSDAQHRTIESWVASAFQQSPWYAAEATAMMPVALSGRYDARLESKHMTVTAPYTVTEHATVDRGPMKRPLEIETRSERAFAYEVEQFEARYHLDATLNLQLGEASTPLVVRVDWADKRSAYQHNVSFPAAGVYPRQANLPTVNGWLSIRLTRKRDALLKKLEGRWAKAFCAAPQFGLEEAARCLYGGGPGAKAALAAVTAAFGQDTETAVDQMVRRRVQKVAAESDGDAKAAAPDEPAVEDVTPTSSESI
jgi:hypothetical protein